MIIGTHTIQAWRDGSGVGPLPMAFPNDETARDGRELANIGETRAGPCRAVTARSEDTGKGDRT